jgi:uncharacterized protein (TIGR02271 family)
MTRKPLAQLDDWQLENSDQDLRGHALVDERGNRIGTIDEMIVDTDVEYVVALVLDDGTEVSPDDIEIVDDTVYLVGTAPVETVAPVETMEPVETVAPVETAAPPREGDEIVVPIIEEDLRIGKRAVERGGIRVAKRVEEVPVEEQVTLRDENIDIQRRRVDRPATAADLDNIQQGAFEIRETDEEAIVDKQARIVEEVVISKDVEERTETVQDTVRRTNVDADELGDRKQGS